MDESVSASWTVFNCSGMTPLSVGMEKCWLDTKISFAKQMLTLSQPIRPCPIIVRKREIRVWFSSTGNTPKAFDFINCYHVVLIINIPTATTAGELRGNMHKYAGVGSAEGMWHCCSHGIPFVTAGCCVSRYRVLWSPAGLRNFNPLHHIATYTCITLAFDFKRCILGPAAHTTENRGIIGVKTMYKMCPLLTVEKSSNS